MTTTESAQTGTAVRSILSLTGVSKSFGGAAALRMVDFDVRPGEVHALVGMNGAGKSTLVGVMSGAHEPDGGEILVDGAEITALTPRKAREAGVSTVPQKRTLVRELSVAENLFLGDLPRRAGWVGWRATRAAARDALRRVGLEIDESVPAGSLSAAEQTMVEIAREVHRGGKVLILDEPTASLGGAAAEQVRDLVRRLRSQGTAIVYISHHLDEILDIADRVTVLRDGRKQLTVPVNELDMASLVFAIAGERVDSERPPRHAVAQETRLRLTEVTSGARLRGLSLDVRAGEVVAVLGPAGDGQSALFPLLAGTMRPDDGALEVDGRPVGWGSVAASLRSGLRCVTGDRLVNGLIGALGIDENIVLAEAKRSGLPWVNWSTLHRKAARLRADFGVVTLQKDPPVGQLSGGNQQKVLLAKWLADDPRVCFLEDPTNGVDVHAKAEIHRLIDDLAARGTAVLLASSDVAEVQRLADRVVVISAGRPTAVLDVSQTTRDELIALTVGGTHRD